MSAEKFSLSWNEFGRNVEHTFKTLLNDKNFTDVTLVSADSKQIKAHKVILSSRSKFFNQILLENPHQPPLLFLKGIRHSDLLAIVQFIYLGQTEVAQDDLNHFMEAAKVLQVQGLNENDEPVPDFNDKEKEMKPYSNQEANFELDHVDYELENQASVAVEEESSQVYFQQQDKYLETKKNYFDKNDDGKYSCDRCDYQTKYSNNLRM